MVENGDSDLVPAFSIWNHNCVIIELASDPKPPVQTHGNSTRQATFEELDWNESETELERQAQTKNEMERWHKDMEAEQTQNEMEEAMKIQKKQDDAGDRQCKHHARVI